MVCIRYLTTARLLILWQTQLGSPQINGRGIGYYYLAPRTVLGVSEWMAPHNLLFALLNILTMVRRILILSACRG